MWQCSNCRETVDDAFDVCWNCGTGVDGQADPAFAREPNDSSIPDTGPTRDDALPQPRGHVPQANSDPRQQWAACSRWVGRVPRLAISLILITPLVWWEIHALSGRAADLLRDSFFGIALM